MPTEATGQEPHTPVRINATSATERAVFRKCRRQWFLSVVHRLQGQEGNPNFWFGELIHAGLEGYYRAVMADGPWAEAHAAGLRAYDAAYERSLEPIVKAAGWLWPKFQDLYTAKYELGAAMLAGYFEHERTHPLGKPVQVEQRLWVPIYRGGRKIGRLSVRTDIVVRRRGGLAAVDHKTYQRRATSMILDIDDQLTAEVYAVWKATGEFPETAIYNGLLKETPGPPRHLQPRKDGTPKLSKDKSQPTTHALYLEEILRLGLDPNDYDEHLRWLRQTEAAGENWYFVREETFRTPGQMAEFERNLGHEFADMKAVARRPDLAYPSPSPFSCPSCPVRQICQTIMDGDDPSVLIQAKYQVGDPRY